MGNRDDTKIGRWPTAICPHCRKRVRVMPSGLLELHVVKGRWKSSPCRGSGVKSTLRG